MKYFTMLPFMLLICMISAISSSFGSDRLPVILFDQAHNQRFLIEQSGDLQLSGLADTFKKQGARVISSKAPISAETLKDVSGLVISGAFDKLKPEEIAAVRQFLSKGGRLAVMLHIGFPVADLLGELGIDISNSVLHERRNILKKNDLDFIVKNVVSDHVLFKGLSQFSAYGVWALNSAPPAATIASTSPDAWIDLNGDGHLSKGDATGSFAVVVTGKKESGHFVIFGDDAIFQNKFLDQDNRKLAQNLGAWLIRR
ncbi:MAG TPA: DUF4350 domain-containing protein [Desulfuromonadaceae bacterium]|jgi:hypothetical protein